jgi:hypothetical protein
VTQYLISFNDGMMIFPEEELPDVAQAAHAVVCSESPTAECGARRA